MNRARDDRVVLFDLNMHVSSMSSSQPTCNRGLCCETRFLTRVAGFGPTSGQESSSRYRMMISPTDPSAGNIRLEDSFRFAAD